MITFRFVCAAVLVLSLTACLKITGEAKDDFDLAEQAPSLSIGKLSFLRPDTNDASEQQKQSIEEASAVRTNAPPSRSPITDTGVESESANSAINPQDFAEFEKWKNARDSDSTEYQQFREYQEFKEFREWQESQKTPNP